MALVALIVGFNIRLTLMIVMLLMVCIRDMYGQSFAVPKHVFFFKYTHIYIYNIILYITNTITYAFFAFL